MVTGIGSPLTTSFAAPPSPDFSIYASPNTATTNAGTPVQTTINVNALNGFTGSVSLSAALPAGWSTDPATNSVTGSGSYTLTITPPTGTAPATYPVTVTGTSNTLSHATTVNVQITKPDFSLTANPTSLSIRQGAHGTSQITVNPLNLYTGSVTLSAKTTTSSITFSFNTNPPAAGTAATLTINVSSSTSRGTYTVTVTGTDTSGLTHQTNIRLTVNR